MKAYTEYLTFNTEKRRELIRITDTVKEAVRKSGVKEGLCLVSAMHLTAAVIIQDDEEGLHEDIWEWLERLAPFKPDYKHHRTGEDNGDAHLKNLLVHLQVEEFEDVNLVEGEVAEVTGSKGNFKIVLSDGREFEADLVVFATGFHSFDVKTNLVEVIPHPRSPRPGKIALKPKAEGVYVAGLAAGEITMVATAAGSGVDVACEILSEWAGKVVVGHDKISG